MTDKERLEDCIKLLSAIPVTGNGQEIMVTVKNHLRYMLLERKEDEPDGK